MSEETFGKLSAESMARRIEPRHEPTTQRRMERSLIVAFVTAVVALYAAIGYGIYMAIALL